VTREDGRQVLAAAREKGVRVGCAPDTFLGGGLQTCRKLIDEGWIGQPVAATAFFVQHGPESWHPNPDFFYQVGAGPLFDMGPYYLTALITLLGPVKRLAGSARISFPERIATSEEQRGRRIPVEVPTHVAGVLDFAGGPIATLITSFDVWASRLPRIEVYGSEGTLSAPDPNVFGGPVRVRRAGAEEWSDIPLTHSAEVGRGIGVADMAYALRHDRPHRVRADVAFHVLDVMQALGESSERGRFVEVTSDCARPAPLPMGLNPGELDA
jgi:predicted dehydrogenase